FFEVRRLHLFEFGWQQNPGGIDEDVHPAEGSVGFIDRAENLLPIRDVARDGHTRAARLRDLVCKLGEQLLSPREQCDFGASLAERERDVVSDSARSAGYHDPAVREEGTEPKSTRKIPLRHGDFTSHPGAIGTISRSLRRCTSASSRQRGASLAQVL